LETVSWREARLSSQSDSGIAPSPKTRALWNGQSRAVTGSHGGVARQRKDGLTDATSCCCALRQGIEREFPAQRVQVPSKPCTQPCTQVYGIFAPLDSGPRYGTARAVLSVVVQAKRHAGWQLPRCRLCFPTKQDADDAAPFDLDATWDSFFSSRGGSSRFVLSRSPSDRDLLTLHKVHNGESG
jgi:hypothetical protein